MRYLSAGKVRDDTLLLTQHIVTCTRLTEQPQGVIRFAHLCWDAQVLR